MEQSSFIHTILREYNYQKHKDHTCYFGSILMVNKNIPLFETIYGSHEYDWLLKVTENRKCVQTRPLVIRYQTGHNLSMDYKYRMENLDMLIDLLTGFGNFEGVRRAYCSTAKFLYKIGKYKESREYFTYGAPTVKNYAYYFTSFFPPLARWVVRKYNVFG